MLRMFPDEMNIPGRLAGGLLAVAFTVISAGMPVAAAEILSHRALYNLSLAGPVLGSRVTHIEGLMSVEWSDTCGGYATNQRIVLRMLKASGEGVSSNFEMTTWESADGLELQFHSRDRINGRVSDEFDGHAKLESHGGEGNVVLTARDGESLRLQRGTIFPTEHTLELIRRAENGERIFSRDVFDGSSGMASLYAASAIIGAPFDADDYAPESEGAALLRGVKSWPVTIAFFPYAKDTRVLATTPDYEIAFRLFANGVVAEMILDYQDFKVRGTLGKIEELVNSGC